MKFAGALQMLEMGVPMTRTSWDNQDEYIFLEGGIFMKNATAYAHPIPIVFYSHEILADDWEVVRQKNA